MPLDYLSKSYNGATLTYTANSNDLLSTVQAETESTEIQARVPVILYPGTQYKAYFDLVACDQAQPETNYVCEFGLFSERDGVFFRVKNGQFYVVFRSSSSGAVIEEEIPQS